MASKTGAVINKTVSWINEVKKNKIIAGILLLIQGILWIIRPQSTIEGLGRQLAIFALIGCAAALIEFFASKDRTAKSTVKMVIGFVLAVCAVIIIVRPNLVSNILVYAVAVLAIGNGAVNTWQLFRLGGKVDAKKIAGIVVNVLSVGLGISLLFKGNAAAEMTIRLVGIILIVNALTDLWTFFLMQKKLKEAR